MIREFNFFVLIQCLLHLTRQSSIIIVEEPSASCQPCYRKLFAGKRLAEVHVRRTLGCEQIEDCGRECNSEKGFSCEGFNYRHPGSRGRTGFCELTAMPPSRIDLGRDILREPHYDYYERDLGCHNNRPLRPSYPQHESGWMNIRPSHGGSGRPVEIPRPPIDIPRPLRPLPRPPQEEYVPRRPHGSQDRFEGEPPPWRPSHASHAPIPPINIRPIEDEVRIEFFRPGRPYLPKEPPRGPPSIGYRPLHHDPGANEIEPYQPGRRKDPAGYGGVYGGSYGYNTNYIDRYDPPKRGDFLNHDKRPHHGGPNDAVYGDVYNYGGAFGYGDNYIPADRDVAYGGSGRPDHCSIRLGAGFKLRRSIVRKSYLTPTLDHCENLCATEKDCVCSTFSYRYSLAANAPTDNCLLSEISYRELDFYTDLEPDRDYDIYAVTGNVKSCEKRRPPAVSHRPPEECFWRVRSGCGVPPEVVRKTLVAQGLGECEAECVESHLFTCRSFVYRYGDEPGRDGAPNCFLSDWPSQELDPLSLPDLHDAELYQRASFGRGCEPAPFPPLNYRSRRPDPEKRPAKKDEVCYAEYQRPCRLLPDAVVLTVYVDSEYECRERCSEMREKGRVPCMSFSYRISNERQERNCFMSDVPRRDLRPGIDYEHGDGYFLFAWKEFEPHCDSGFSIGVFFDDDFQPNDPIHRPGGFDTPGDYHNRPLPVPAAPHSPHLDPPFARPPSGGGGFDYGVRPGRPHGNRNPSTSGYDDDRLGGRPFGDGGHGTGHRPGNEGGYYASRPFNPDRPDPVGPVYGPGGNKRPIQSGGVYGEGSDGRFGSGDSDDRHYYSHINGGSTFQFFTVNGQPCKRGTKCERNKVAGFWSCEPEGGEFGSWDYCCEPNHHCGYSQGYHYPWCYVGPYEDQWRPCSERYYPYLPNPRPSQPQGDRYQDHETYGEVPRPGLLGRHWPVAYLHKEAPPNSTDSLAIADSRRNRELNVSLAKDSAPRGRGSSLEEAEKKSSESRTRGNRNVVVVHDASEDRITPIGRAGRIERVRTRFAGSRREEAQLRASSLISRERNGTEEFLQRNKEGAGEFAEVLELKDILDGDAYDENNTESPWRKIENTKFVEVPTISPNRTRKPKFLEYFEIVDID